mmetsp:Transcript_27600/g.51479  ORF Transcript_27600/g.51479 Transcript_27600/m.51479 type:complete len:360 (-) Transcript_27600:320-1399(-)
MGVCSLSEAEPPARTTDNKDSVRKDGKGRYQVVKLVLLGAGESGKTTLCRQMKVTYGDGFSRASIQEHRALIRSNLVLFIRILIDEAEERNTGRFSKEVEELIEDVKDQEMDDNGKYHLTEDLAQSIGKIWRDPPIQKVYSMRSKYQLDDNAKHFLDKAESIGRDAYKASEEDIIRSRVRTVGRSKIRFDVRGQMFEMEDVGGQRSERAEGKRGFDNVTSVIFVAALSAYDQTLIDDSKRSMMEETLDLFEEVISSDDFKNLRECSLILFLNKKDIFKEKLEVEKIPLGVCPAFRNYKGSANYEEAIEFVCRKFRERNVLNREIFIYDVCAVDRQNVIRIFNAIKKTVLKSALDYAGLF